MTRLTILTHSYPFGERTDFLEDEIGHLSRAFQRVQVVPTRVSGPPQQVPAGVEVDLSLLPSMSRHALIRAAAQRGVRRDIRRELTEAGTLQPRPLAETLMAACRSEAVRRWAEDREAPNVAYTYWLGPATVGLRRAWPGTPIVSRAHGGDLYWERSRSGHLPLQSSAVDAATFVACVSDDGLAYLSRRYPTQASKFVVRRLGIRGATMCSPGSADGRIRMLSVSSLTAVKRPMLIAEFARLLSKNIGSIVEWDHVGDGPMRGELEAFRAQHRSAQLRIRLRGWMQNDDLLVLLAQGPWDLFVNLSSSEGVPVSIMEAISAGLPVVATDVGGSREAVVPELDVLLGPDASVDDMVTRVLASIDTTDEGRARRRQHWQDHFDASTNYGQFAEWLAELARSPS